MAAAKKAATATLVKLFVNAGQATPTPPIGPALGQRGVKAIDFCKQFNDRTKDILPGTPMRVLIQVRPDRTFSFHVKPPMTSYLLKKAAGVEKGAARPGTETVGTISLKHLYEIAKIKATDPQMDGLPLESVCKVIMGSARSAGITIVP